jgi:hypothetical protein
MTIENDVLREDFRARTKAHEIRLPEYSADLQVQRRVGNIVAGGASYLSHVQRKSVVNSIQTRLPQKAVAFDRPGTCNRTRQRVARHRCEPVILFGIRGEP